MKKFLLSLLALGTLYFLLKGYKPGRSLLQKVKRIGRLRRRDWSTAFLESKRSKTDPAADGLIRYILENQDENGVNTVFRSLVRNNEIPAGLPPLVQAYFDTGTTLPAWADRDLLATGEDIFLRHGTFISLILSSKSLPQCYACAKGAMVLYDSGRLNDQSGAMDAFTRRIVETAQFVVDVLSPGGLAPGGKGIRAAQKVRLIHASIRYYLGKKNWDTALYDEPINQEDLAGTLMSFSALILDGLKLLNINLSDVEEEAFYHCWKVVGHFMGIDQDLLPVNVADARALGNAIFSHQMIASRQGTALTGSLIKYKENISPEGKLIGTVHEMLRYMMGDQISDLLQVPAADPNVEAKLRQRLFEWTGVYEEFEHRSFLFGRVAEEMSKLVLQGMLDYMNDDKKVYFYIPETLRQDWGIQQPV